MNGKIAMAMSGGVDSSVAALLLHQEGQDLVGLSLQLHDQSEGSSSQFGRCCSPRDFMDARQVAERIGIPFYVLNMEEEFRQRVLLDFVNEYSRGRTPLPCAHCNTKLKFGDLWERARTLGCDQVGTGHYARMARDPVSGRTLLMRARDREKDQSYFLHGLSMEQLERSRFPLGDLTKTQVRARARDAGLSVAEKPESMDICFLGPDGYRGVLEREMGDEKPAGGEIVDGEGRVLGHHAGIHRFTIGQRKGLGLNGGGAHYVVELRPEQRQVVVGSENDQYQTTCRVIRPNWIGRERFARPLEALVQIRYRHPGAEATLECEGAEAVRIRFREPQRAITPGQAAVFYQGDEVLGGGFIAARN